jgi:hypothetical protein
LHQVPSDAGRPPEKIGAGDGVAVDPRTGALLIQRFDNRGAHLFRLAKPGARLVEVPVAPGPLRLGPVTLAAGAVHEDGRVLVTAASGESVFWRPAVLGPEGRLQPLPVKFDGDVIPSAWTKDGKVLGMGYALRGELWRFAPVATRAPGS